MINLIIDLLNNMHKSSLLISKSNIDKLLAHITPKIPTKITTKKNLFSHLLMCGYPLLDLGHSGLDCGVCDWSVTAILSSDWLLPRFSSPAPSVPAFSGCFRSRVVVTIRSDYSMSINYM